jgi:hypothetical protein
MRPSSVGHARDGIAVVEVKESRPTIRERVWYSGQVAADDLEAAIDAVGYRVKGLEFDHVILVAHDETVSDELLYVGLSRAVMSAVLIGPSPLLESIAGATALPANPSGLRRTRRRRASAGPGSAQLLERGERVGRPAGPPTPARAFEPLGHRRSGHDLLDLTPEEMGHRQPDLRGALAERVVHVVFNVADLDCLGHVHIVPCTPAGHRPFGARRGSRRARPVIEVAIAAATPRWRPQRVRNGDRERIVIRAIT